MEPADKVVIGAGTIGRSEAFHLARLGAGRIVVLAKGTIFSGATGESNAIIRQHYSNPTGTRLAREIGRCIAESIVDGQPALVDLNPIRTARFAEGRPWADDDDCAPKLSTSRQYR